MEQGSVIIYLSVWSFSCGGLQALSTKKDRHEEVKSRDPTKVQRDTHPVLHHSSDATIKLKPPSPFPPKKTKKKKKKLRQTKHTKILDPCPHSQKLVRYSDYFLLFFFKSVSSIGGRGGSEDLNISDLFLQHKNEGLVIYNFQIIPRRRGHDQIFFWGADLCIMIP